MASICCAIGLTGSATGTVRNGGTGSTAATAPAAGCEGAGAAAPPLKLHSLAPDTAADPFPPVNPKFFTAESPTVGDCR